MPPADNEPVQQASMLPIHLLSIGSFGKAVAEHLRKLRGDVVETRIVDHVLPMPEVWPAARLNVVASWRPAPTVCELLQELSYHWRKPFIPVLIEELNLQIGPVLIPGEGSCWTCWARRSRQHSPWPWPRSLMMQHYAQNAADGPGGYLEPFTAIAAARLSRTIDTLDSSSVTAGAVWQIDMLTRQITAGQVVGIHDCPRCGLHRPAPTRSFSAMQQDLSYLWASLSAGGD